VVVQSISQPLNDDSTGQMVESILVAFDAYTSKEISKHTARGRKENARQGFWNGSRPPFGYAAVDAQQIARQLGADDRSVALNVPFGAHALGGRSWHLDR
jgi:DNA invertase Pin-like site-specific DNA recombinase